MNILYLDAAASMPMYPKVLLDMKKYFTESYGNPSSLHELGREAHEAIEQARAILAKEIGAKPWEISFTSGVTEANNWMFHSLTEMYPAKKKIIISSVEHASIREPCERLRKKGYLIESAPVNMEGVINLEIFEKMIDSKTLVVSIMHVNNILGTIQPIEKIGAICKKKGVLFHTDAAQSFSKLSIDVKKQEVDLLSASGHKIGGPKGIGFLYARETIKPLPLFVGGGQERGTRAGTENVPAIVGFASAIKEHKKNYSFTKLKALRNYFIDQLEIVGAQVTNPRQGMPHIIQVAFPGRDAPFLVEYLSKSNVYASAGSACESKRGHEDHALKAIGLSSKIIEGSLRISFLPTLSKKDIDLVCVLLKKALKIKP